MAKTVRRTGKKKEKKNITEGVAHIQSTFNNTIITNGYDRKRHFLVVGGFAGI